MRSANSDRLRNFVPNLRPGVLDVRMALWEMRRK